ncbi:MAG: transporter substrate-binding domain-containing protein [Clostridia bacterium]|nr:transporter substrate-binding domain-containing protein [Clostridia bacterium]
MKKFTKVISIVLSVMMLAVVFAGCGAEKAASDIEYVENNGKMVIGYTIYEPMNYEENGELTGFDTEFAEAVCEKLGVEPEFVVIDWDNKFLELDSKSIDCIWNGMTITEEAKLNASVSKAYVKNAQVVVMNKDKAADYKSAEDMKELKFVAEAGSAGEAAINDNGLNANYTAVAAQSDALLEVMSGSADACVIDITMANAMTGEGTSYAALTSVCELTTEEYGIAFRKNSDITEKVNAIIDELKSDGTLEALAEKYALTLAF